MPRNKRASNARGSRNTGIVSGATIALTPSGGVTISLSGLEYTSGSFVTPTEIGYLAGAAGYPIANVATAALQVRHGIADYANNPGSIVGFLNIDTGLTTVVTAIFNFYESDALAQTSDVTKILGYWSGGDVTVGLYTHSAFLGATAQNGVSIAWTAFGV